MAIWTEQENDILRKYFATAPWDDLMVRLPSRTRSSISQHAHGLGIKREITVGETSKWTEAETALLYQCYATTASWDDLLAIFPNRSVQAIQQRAFKLRLKRRVAAGKASRNVCPDCGGHKKRSSILCQKCRWAWLDRHKEETLSKRQETSRDKKLQRELAQANQAICPDCSGPKNSYSVRCWRCNGIYRLQAKIDRLQTELTSAETALAVYEVVNQI